MSKSTVEQVIVCACRDHAIGLDGWSDGDLFIQLWVPSAVRNHGRWYWVWESLRGRWSGDNEVVLNPVQVAELRDALDDHLLKTTEEA